MEGRTNVANMKTRLGRRGVRSLVVALLAGAALTACGANNSDRVLFNGVYYKAKAKPVSKDDRARFSVKVPRVDRGFDGALAAGAHEATRYCIENFGTSDIEWYQGPEGEQGTIPVSGNTVTFTGKCVTW